MTELNARFRNEHYGMRETPWSAAPNDLVVAAAAELAPGRALDVACGEGADAVRLAECGWDVAAVDISAVALARGRAHEATGRIAWLEVDLLAWTPPAATYDLVTAHFVHFAAPERRIVFGGLAAAVRPNGVLLIVAHHPSDLQTTAGRRPMPAYYYTAEELAAELAPHDWEIAEASARPRPAIDPAGRSIVVHDAVLRARRRARPSPGYRGIDPSSP